MFKGILINKDDTGYRAELCDIDEAQLTDNGVSINVEYSTLNYKDALAITGKSPIIRKFPLIPGIDLAGTVEQSNHPDYQAGDAVVLNGWGVGESHNGGLAQKANLKAEWLVPLPANFTTKQAMAIGTAGYTAMLCVMALEKHGVTPDSGEILVTGATGGVGSVAVSVLAKLGYQVIAMTGRSDEAEYVKALGATEIMPRSEYSEAGRPLAKERWAGVVDVVGSHVLANAIAATRYNGVVTACGLAGGMDLPATVAPFILRGVTLAGVESVMCPLKTRLEAWRRLGEDLDISKLDAIAHDIKLSDTIDAAEQLLDGRIRGRVIVDVNR
jgi:acrylyl-CoA reductase (NADPH)